MKKILILTHLSIEQKVISKLHIITQVDEGLGGVGGHLVERRGVGAWWRGGAGWKGMAAWRAAWIVRNIALKTRIKNWLTV